MTRSRAHSSGASPPQGAGTLPLITIEQSPYDSISPTTVRRALAILALTALVAIVWPTQWWGASSYVVVAGPSMQPVLNDGDFVWAQRSLGGRYEPGDVIVFRAPEVGGPRVIHRVVSVDDDGVIGTQGDNKDSPDPWEITSEQVDGRMIVVVPAVGGMMASGGFAIGLGLAAAAIVLTLLWPRRAGDGLKQ